jgi:hypothetical protein
MGDAGMLPKFRPAPIAEGEVRPTIRPVKLTAPPPPPPPPSPAKRAASPPSADIPSEDSPQFAGDAPETWVPPRRQVEPLAKITYQPARFEDPAPDFDRNGSREPNGFGALDAYASPFDPRRRPDLEERHGQLTPPSLSGAPAPRPFEPRDSAYAPRVEAEHPRHARTRAYRPSPEAEDSQDYPPARRDYVPTASEGSDAFRDTRAPLRKDARRELSMRERERERERDWERDRERERERERIAEYTYPPEPRREMNREPRPDFEFGAFPHAPTPPATAAPAFTPNGMPYAMPQTMPYAMPQTMPQTMPYAMPQPPAVSPAFPAARLHTTSAQIVQTVPSQLRSLGVDAAQRAKTVRFAWFVFGAAFGICFAFFATGFATRIGKREEGLPASAAMPAPEAVLPGTPAAAAQGPGLAAPRPAFTQSPVAPQAPVAVAPLPAPQVPVVAAPQPAVPPPAPRPVAAPQPAPPPAVQPAPVRRTPSYGARATGEPTTSSRRNSDEATDLLNAGLAP